MCYTILVPGQYEGYQNTNCVYNYSSQCHCRPIILERMSQLSLVDSQPHQKHSCQQDNDMPSPDFRIAAPLVRPIRPGVKKSISSTCIFIYCPEFPCTPRNCFRTVPPQSLSFSLTMMVLKSNLSPSTLKP